MKHIEDTFSYANESIRLSDAEKADGRARLLAVMQDRPMGEPVRSPLSGSFFPMFARYAVAAVLFLAVGGGGVAYAATDAQPADTLYVVKVKVNEPVQVALTFDQKKRADLEVQLVNERLKEVAMASVDTTLTPGQMTLVTDSLFAQIDHAQDDIAGMHADQQSDDALQTASDLTATLSAHTAILEKVQEVNPEASNAISAVVTTVAGEIAQTNTLVDTTQDAVSSTATSTLDAPTDQQADETGAALAQVKQEVAEALSDFDASDRTDVNAAIADIQATIADAQAKDAAGDTKAAYLLYTDANTKLTTLKLTIEADQSLNIDTISAMSVDSAGGN